MVGRAAGTIKNVWCRISDRHRRFGHNAPLSAAGDFKRLCKAVAAVKGAPSKLLSPPGLSPLAAAFGPNNTCNKAGTVRPCRRVHGLLNPKL